MLQTHRSIEQGDSTMNTSICQICHKEVSENTVFCSEKCQDAFILFERIKTKFPAILWEYTEGPLVISCLQVMQSAAGFYVGRSCVEETENGYLLPQPYCRESDYMTEENAHKYLLYLKE